ncbi:host specificity factor TipJ family phage tail protein [Roseovarius sp.]
MLDNAIETVAQQHPLEARASFRRAQAGATVAEIVAAHNLPAKFGPPCVVLIRNGQMWPVPMDNWGKVRPKEGTRVEIGYPINGPAIGAVLTAVVSAAAPAIAGSVAGFLGVTSALGVGLITAAVTVVGGLIIQALIPPPRAEQSIPGREDAPNFAITGVSNRENRYGIYPKVLGRHRIFPPLSARGFTETRGNDTIFYYGRMALGHGPLAIEDLRIGTTSITEFTGVKLQFLNVDETETLSLSPELAPYVTDWLTGTTTMSLYPGNIAEDPYSVRLNTAEDVIRTTRAGSVSASIDITFPQGLVFIVTSSFYQPDAASFSFSYRAAGSGGAWVDAGNEIYTGSTTSLLRFTKTIDFPAPGEYEIKIRRTDADIELSNYRDDSFLTAIRSIREGDLPSHENIAELAFVLQASDQLSGRVDTLNCIAHQMAPVWNGTAWTAPQRVRHPAWVFSDALRGDHLRRPVEDAKIDADALKAWADEETHWTCDHVIDTPTRLRDVLDLIAATGRAKMTLADLKYSVIRDGGAGPVRQVFTPRNSWGFKGSVSFPRPIHAFRCLVTSERMDWQQDEVTVYADGYNASNATELETLDLPGIVITSEDTTEGNVYRLGRYHLAQAILRPEQFEWMADWEAMRVTRGDKVLFQHDVPVIGIGAGRIKSIAASGSTLTSITLDNALQIDGGDHRISVRAADGTVYTYTSTVSGPAEVTVWPYSSGTIDATDLAVGDLVVVELLSQESMELLITGVYPETDASARLTAVPAAPAVLDAASGTIPAYTPTVTQVRSNPNFGPPRPVVRGLVSDQATAVFERGNILQARAGVTLEPAVSQDVAVAGIQVRWRDVQVTEWRYGEMFPPGSPAVYTGPLRTGETYQVQVRAVGSLGAFQGWVDAGSVAATTQDTPPPDVTGWFASPSEANVQMQWADPGYLDLSHLEIRFSSGASASWEASTLLSKVPYPKLTESVFARAGTYLAKWVDRGGQKSTTAVSTYIAPDQIKAANAVETETVSPTFTGTLSDTEVVSGDLRLVADVDGNYPASGTWTGGTAVDLGAKYPVRISPRIEASAFSPNDAMDAWVSLDALTSLAPSNPNAWAVDVEVAVSDSDTTGGTNWVPLTGGEYIGRYFNFRVTLRSEREDTTPVVELLEFILDMPDRVEGADSVSCPIGGTSVTFSPAYRVTPAIVVTPQNAGTGDYATLSSLSRTGFTVEFFDSSNASVARTFDWVARGYGREST